MYDVDGVANGHLYIRGPLKDINLYGALAPTGQLSINHINTITHEMGFAREVADRVIFVDEGHIAEDAPPAEFFSAPKNERLREFLSKVL